MIEICARCGQVYQPEDNRDDSCLRGPHVDVLPQTGSAHEDWSYKRLLAAFADVCPKKTGEWSIARSSGSGSEPIKAPDTQEEAEVTVRVAPAAELVIRTGGWPVDVPDQERKRLGHDIVRGIVNGLGFVSPPPLACEVSVSHVAHRLGAPGWLLREAARRAFGHASRSCEWDTSIPFPEVAILPDESVDTAGARVVAVFQAAGFRLNNEMGSGPASAGESIRAFTYFSQYAHVFFVCPHPWTSERRSELDWMVKELSYNYGRGDGIVMVEHVLAAYPRA
jgi:hypothetical protein